jgi:hypothetical protein
MMQVHPVKHRLVLQGYPGVSAVHRPLLHRHLQPQVRFLWRQHSHQRLLPLLLALYEQLPLEQV